MFLCPRATHHETQKTIGIMKAAAVVCKASSNVLKQLINPRFFNETGAPSARRAAAEVTQHLPGRRQDPLREAAAHAVQRGVGTGRN